MKNKKAWLRVVEVSVSIMLFLGVLLIFVNQIGSKRISEEIYTVQEGILREIQINDELRNIILNSEESELPVENFSEGEYQKIKNKVDNELPDFLECDEMLCLPENECKKEYSIGKSVYADSLIVSANLTDYDPRRLKLFCWLSN